MIQSKIALTLSLVNYEFRLSKRTKLPLKMETKGIILAPIGGLWIEFKRRNASGIRRNKGTELEGH